MVYCLQRSCFDSLYGVFTARQEEYRTAPSWNPSLDALRSSEHSSPRKYNLTLVGWSLLRFSEEEKREKHFHRPDGVLFVVCLPIIYCSFSNLSLPRRPSPHFLYAPKSPEL